MTSCLGTTGLQVQGVVLMAPLGSGQDCSPAEALHTSQGEPSSRARKAGSKHGFSVWFMASWNVRTLLDVDGYIETAKQSCDVSVWLMRGRLSRL